ncbi:hypothetical protein H4CHR_05730 [Variovorax sp. PBS-H4]|nr:hypothetical protein H4CHR_05730 [Variovorax sp. PBS-H4]
MTSPIGNVAAKAGQSGDTAQVIVHGTGRTETLQRDCTLYERRFHDKR